MIVLLPDCQGLPGVKHLIGLRNSRAGSEFKLGDDATIWAIEAIDDALHGGSPMSPAVARIVLSELRTPTAIAPPCNSMAALTARECGVIEELARGLSYSDVALCLDISVNTVRAHVRSIYDKLSVTSKTEAVVEALRLGVIRN